MICDGYKRQISSIMPLWIGSKHRALKEIFARKKLKAYRCHESRPLIAKKFDNQSNRFDNQSNQSPDLLFNSTANSDKSENFQCDDNSFSSVDYRAFNGRDTSFPRSILKNSNSINQRSMLDDSGRQKRRSIVPKKN